VSVAEGPLAHYCGCHFLAKRVASTHVDDEYISLPDELKEFVDHRIQSEGYGSSSEYMRELIRRDRDRAQFRQYLLDGIDAKPIGRMDAAYFAALRKQLKAGSRKNA
jgi:antitoxin ParD1/3/4